MKVLVTGGMGYIGRILVPDLVKIGYKVSVIDRKFLNYDDVETEFGELGITCKIDDIRFCEPAELKGFDAIVDLAALSNDPSGNLEPMKTWDINYLGRVRIARLAKKLGATRYIVASSCSIYGFREEVANENTPPNPLTVYAEANRAVERDNLFLADDKFSPTALRFATAFGYSKRLRLDIAINAMVYNALTMKKIKLMRDGEQYRPFIHVKDMSRAIIRSLEADSDLISGQIFNAGSNQLNVKLRDVAEMVRGSVNGSEIEWYGDPDRRSYKVDFKKISETIKFITKYDIKYGINEMIKEFSSVDFKYHDEMITLSVYRKLIEAEDFLTKHAYKGRKIGL